MRTRFAPRGSGNKNQQQGERKQSKVREVSSSPRRCIDFTAGFSPKVNILTFAAYKQAPALCAENANSILHTRCKRRVFVLAGCIDFTAGFSPTANISAPCALKASFQIFGWDMRTRILLRKTSSSHSTALTKKRTARKERFSFFGRSGGTRTRGLQYPNKYAIVF